MSMWSWRSVAPSVPVEKFREQVNRGLLDLENALPTVLPRLRVRTLTADTILLGTDGMALVDTTAGNVTVTLPEAAINRGRRLTVKKTIAANTLTVDTLGSETIDGAATLAWATRYQSHDFLSDGANWWIL